MTKTLFKELESKLREVIDILEKINRSNEEEGSLKEEEAVIEKVMPKGGLEAVLTELFLELGIPMNIKGFKYLRSAVKYVLENGDVPITKELYPAIAAMYATTPSRVERAIRHAIEHCCSNEKTNSELESIFANSISNGRQPTNSQFITTIAALIQE